MSLNLILCAKIQRINEFFLLSGTIIEIIHFRWRFNFELILLSIPRILRCALSTRVEIEESRKNVCDRGRISVEKVSNFIDIHTVQ